MEKHIKNGVKMWLCASGVNLVLGLIMAFFLLTGMMSWYFFLSPAGVGVLAVVSSFSMMYADEGNCLNDSLVMYVLNLVFGLISGLFIQFAIACVIAYVMCYIAIPKFRKE